jgi:hypothetical protein
MEVVYYVSVGIYAISMIISALLLYIYAKNYRHIKSHYNIGLMIFALLFIIDNAISLHQAIFSWPFDDAMVISHMLLQDVIDLIGLSALLYITWE